MDVDESTGGTVAGAALTGELRTTDGGAVVCALHGDLDLDGVGAARALFARAAAERPALLAVDLSGVGFCDSSGLNLLLQLRLDAQRDGFALRIAAPPAQLRRLLEITGATAVLAPVDSLEAALA
ncbi:STAS domain-containing protein [Kitasatospora sp. NA04385]|uniref:STAS domain-containing protein n=1 Tax=Kitasatospora sp. NA04385 TaxID=2742135 RepID=UPI0015908B48|nr:STAS domain-containing protein [Kitasatospora sp. NA04385]QKW21908.1 STAS domain-containing protein [Kitasatospora sp. NA04385]